MRTANDPYYLEFITHLRKARLNKGWSQATLAAQLGKPQSYVSKIETCERRVDLVEAARIAMALDVSLDELLPQRLRSSFSGQSREGEGL